MSLFFLLTLITFFDAYKTRLISVLIKIIPQDPKVGSLGSDIKVMERELSTISMTQEYANYIKLQRKINKLKEERKELVKKDSFRMMKIRYVLATGVYIVVIGTLITIIWLHRSETVAKVPAQWLWPISSFFDWSYYAPGCITVPCWIAISSSASKTIARHF